MISMTSAIYRENGKAYVAFSLSDYYDISSLTATFTCGTLNIDIPILKTNVGFKEALESTEFVLVFPQIEHSSKQSIRISYLLESGQSKTVGVIAVKPQPKGPFLQLERKKFAASPLPKLLQGAEERYESEQSCMSLIGLFPLDANNMVCRVQVNLPKSAKFEDWRWSAVGGKYFNNKYCVELLDKGIAANANTIAILSCKVPRNIANLVIFARAINEPYLTLSLGVPPSIRDSALNTFYQLTTDAKADHNYAGWFIAHRPTPRELENQIINQPATAPLLSIVVPIFKPPLAFLSACVSSMLAQTYKNWELILVNASPDDSKTVSYLSNITDSRIIILNLEGNRGIAGNTNAGIAASSGAYIGFIDQDDVIEPNALYEYALAIAEKPDTDLLYCDEDNFNSTLNNVYSPLFKPPFNPDLLFGHNYVIHLLMISKHAYSQVTPSPDYTSGAQDYDLTLKIAEVARRIIHIPKVLYHWRQHAGSTNAGNMAAKPYAEEAGKRALEDCFARRQIRAKVSIAKTPAVYQSIFEPTDEKTLVSVIVSSKDYDSTLRCITSLDKNAGYSNYEIVVPLQEHPKEDDSLEGNARVRTLQYSEKDSADWKNHAAASSKGEVLLFLDSSLEIISREFLKIMLGYFQRQEVGLVGALSFYKDGTIKDAGIAQGRHGEVIHFNRNHTLETNKGYQGSLECGFDYPALRSRCLMVRRSDHEKNGGFSAEGIIGDLAYCDTLSERGLYMVYSPYLQVEDKDYLDETEETPKLVSNSSITSNVIPNCNALSAYFGL